MPSCPWSPDRRARLALLCLIIATGGCDRGADRPDLLLITIDTLRADHLGCMGHPSIATPVIDSLAAAGIVFEDAICQVPLTLPSHCSMMTGLYPHRHGVRVNEDALPAGDPVTLAQRLSASGYTSAAFVGAFPLAAQGGLARGFAVYDDRFTTAEERRLPTDHRRRAERRADQVVDAVLDWLGADRSPSVFLWVHFYDPHDPYEPPVGEGYEGEIEFVDREIGRLLAGIRAARHERPLVVVTADHGEGLGEHQEPTHGLFVYDTTIRIPWIMSGPGVTGGARHAGQIETVDLLPTLLEMTGVEPVHDLDGRSLVPALAGETTPGRVGYIESLYAEQMGWAPLRGVRDGTWKYIEAPRPELYHLARDPDETENRLATEPEQAATLTRGLETLATGERPAATRRDPVAGLRALGYVTGGASGPGAGRTPADTTAPDPKDRAPVAIDIARAEALLLARRDDEALGLLVEIAAVDPHNPFVTTRLGNLHKRLGRLDTAVNAYRRALAAAPHAAEPAYQLADTFFRQGAGDSAIAWYRRAIDLAPQRVAAHTNLGACLLQAGRTSEARESFERAIALDPGHGTALGNLAATEFVLGNRERACELFLRAREALGERFGYHYELGQLLAERGDLEAAEAALRRVTGNKRALAGLELAAVAIHRGHHDRALALLGDAIARGGDEVRGRVRNDPRFTRLLATPDGDRLLRGTR